MSRSNAPASSPSARRRPSISKPGAKRVIVSAPADGVDFTLVMGVNSDRLTREHRVISNGSCTTNCLAPVAYVLNEGIGIERGYMTTIHSYTGDQNTVDTLHKDLRRARAAALSMIPTSTGAARAMGLVMPALKGKLDGTSIRVPTANVSLIDLSFDAARDTSAEEINELMAGGRRSDRFKGILAVNRDETVSRSISSTTRTAPSSTSPRRWCWTSASAACWRGTTTNGASPTAWSRRRRWSARWGEPAHHRAIRSIRRARRWPRRRRSGRQ